MKKIRRINTYLAMILLPVLMLFMAACGAPVVSENSSASGTVESSVSENAAISEGEADELSVDEDGAYTTKDEVALYLHTYGHLPSNYISKTKAKKLGWDASEGNLWDVAYGKSIGGGPFSNREGVLPDGDYRECDLNYDGSFRGPERLVYSDDGRIYYTADHYQTFEQLY